MDSNDGGKTPTVESEILNNEKLQIRLKGCEHNLVLLQIEQNAIWKLLSESYAFLNANCDHEWSRENQLYSPLQCSKCGVKK